MKDYLIRHSAVKQKELKYDFMPELLEIIEKPSNPGASVIIWLIFGLIGTAILWAAFFKLDVVVNASGTIIPEDNIKTIQAAVSGTVEEICVKEGDYVEKGDEIVRLSQDMSRAEAEQAEYNLELIRIQKEIYERLYNGASADKIEPEFYDPYQWMVSGMVEEEKLYQKNLETLKEQAKVTASGALGDLQTESFVMQRRLEIAEKISSCESKITEYETVLKKYKHSLDAEVITAPVSGYISQLNVNTPGETVTPAQPVAGLIPDDGEYIFRCCLPDSDIADIRCGQEARLKIRAYPYSRYGTVKGTVQYISPSAQPVENAGYVYILYITFSDDADTFAYTPGMSGSVEIMTDRRTVLEYFIEPISENLHNSLKER